ncbi:hypothetical protein [Streptomyces griseorubiginosus]|uniref:hypothetical protein n=1 Tax=Streptomyces griseorubiginosus TaxID=67304 RepID=UPI00340E230C
MSGTPETTGTRRGRGQGRVDVAGGVRFRPGHRARLGYRLRVYHHRAGEPKTIAGRDNGDLIITAHRSPLTAHRQLGARWCGAGPT